MKKNLFLFVFVLILGGSLLWSDENAKNEKESKFKFEPGLEFTQEIHFDTVGNKLGINYGWGDAYLKTKGKANFALNFGFYTLTPWIGDFIELPITAASPAIINPKNNFLLGLDNTFSVENVMDIGVNFEFKLGTILDANTITPLNGIEIRLSPILNLSGEYEFGLSFSLSNMFEFYIYPDQNSPFFSVDFEGFNSISFDFFHFFVNNENIKGGLYAELFSLARVFVDGTAPTILNLDPAFGFTFDFYKVTPMILFFTHLYGTDLSRDPWFGIKSGIGFSKEWFSINVVYIGTFSVGSSNWQNHIETYLTFSL